MAQACRKYDTACIGDNKVAMNRNIEINSPE